MRRNVHKTKNNNEKATKKIRTPKLTESTRLQKKKEEQKKSHQIVDVPTDKRAQRRCDDGLHATNEDKQKITPTCDRPLNLMRMSLNKDTHTHVRRIC